MGLILDTIIFNNMVFEPEKLSPKEVSFINQQKDLFITIPTIWETANHVRKGTYDIEGKTFKEFMQEAIKRFDIQLLPISWQAFEWLSHTPYITAHGKPHKDTFDRMIIAHAIVLSTPIITKDNAFAYYTNLGLTIYKIN